MRNSIVFLFWLYLAGSSIGAVGVESTTRIVVRGIDGVPLEGMKVGISYPDLSGNKFDSGDGLTDSDGVYEFRGKAYLEVYYSVQKEGYYFTRGEASIATGKGKTLSTLGSLEIEIIAKEIRDPIVMVATRGAFLMPREHAEEGIGFDLLAGDWVAPAGNGVVADLLLTVVLEKGEDDFFETRLGVAFPNSGDGMVEFLDMPMEGSGLRSDHEAPEDGYFSPKIIVNGRYQVQSPRSGRAEIEYRTNVRKDMNYYLRIRSEFNENGKLISAHYGKVYGDFRVFGHLAAEGYTIRLGGCYYINPTPNDRNMEAVSGESLLEEIDRLDLPNSP